MVDTTELKTDKGVAAYCGDLERFSVLIHLSPEPEGNWPATYQGSLDVILSTKGALENFIGSIPLNDVVGSRGLKFEGGVELSADDCISIDDMCWQVLSSKYGIVPTEFVMPGSR